MFHLLLQVTKANHFVISSPYMTFCLQAALIRGLAHVGLTGPCILL